MQFSFSQIISFHLSPNSTDIVLMYNNVFVLHFHLLGFVVVNSSIGTWCWLLNVSVGTGFLVLASMLLVGYPLIGPSKCPL
jgi:hypothetical protein